LFPELEAAIRGAVDSKLLFLVCSFVGLSRLQVQETTAPLIEASSPANNCSSYRGFKSSKQLLLLSRLQVQETTAPLIEDKRSSCFLDLKPR
jgi:hypothetical protein